MGPSEAGVWVGGEDTGWQDSPRPRRGRGRSTSCPGALDRAGKFVGAAERGVGGRLGRAGRKPSC